MKYTPDEIMEMCMEHVPYAKTFQDMVNLRMAGRLAWEEKEMGGIEHVMFARRNDTPIVPIGHCGHPLELVKRGFVDGHGWKVKTMEERIKLFKWPDGNHWYATIDGMDVVDERQNQKWNTPEKAMTESKKFIIRWLNKQKNT